uniref:Uncharacterized protein LOC117356770 n=1 Tax=Geotrypetes seraphini TaxID=260995 RepID=A0A6P8Q9G9_GEOSA|nr:uncharacterized protein LOC117356770 [Geotrypetes seraphini]
MPKRRGKSAGGASRRPETSPLLTIDEILRRLQQETVMLGNRPLEVLAVSEAVVNLPGLDATLSPDAKTPPPQLQGASSPREDSLAEEADLFSQEDSLSQATEFIEPAAGIAMEQMERQGEAERNLEVETIHPIHTDFRSPSSNVLKFQILELLLKLTPAYPNHLQSQQSIPGTPLSPDIGHYCDIVRRDPGHFAFKRALQHYQHYALAHISSQLIDHFFCEGDHHPELDDPRNDLPSFKACICC